MERPGIRQTVHTALVTAFTIAAALIWKDFFEAVARNYLPDESTLFVELMAALVVTFIVIVAINLLYKAEDEVDEVVEEVEHFRQRFGKQQKVPGTSPKPRKLAVRQTRKRTTVKSENKKRKAL